MDVASNSLIIGEVELLTIAKNGRMTCISYNNLCVCVFGLEEHVIYYTCGNIF